MLFLSNFNTLVGILLGPTDLLESNKDILSFCHWDLQKIKY